MDELASPSLQSRSLRPLPGLVLQRLPLDREPGVRPLFLRAAPGVFPSRARAAASRLSLAPEVEISCDTYFGAFFERAWRGPTGLRSLCLDVAGSGTAVVRVYRRDVSGASALLVEAETALDDLSSFEIPPPLVEGASGRIHATLVAGSEGCEITEIAWRTPDTPAEAVGLVPVFCTFGREQQLGAVLATIAAEQDIWHGLPRVIVVNQGPPHLRSHPAIAGLPQDFLTRLDIIEQHNLGGSGGFTRGLLAAREVQGATHAVLMDDDVAVEPEALRRTAAFFSIAREKVALGGHMLDMLHPTRLYEAGARLDTRTLYLRPHLHLRSLVPRPALDALTRPTPIHYNGWWYFGLPLELLDEVGLPMPCFIRGDDVEFGLRLNQHSIPTVGLPGVAIWHEPFYLKLQGWQGYYELRNGLVYACLHMPRPASAIALLLANRLLGHLLAYRYLDAALVLRATADWLRGPAVFEEPPAELHAQIQALRGEHPVGSLPAGRVAEDLPVPADPRRRLGFGLRMLRALWRNAVVPDRDAAPRRVRATDFLWFRVAAADHVVVDTGWDPAPPTFRRSRATFRRQLRESARLLRRVLREGDQVTRAWREAAPRLTSRAAWEERFRR